MLSLTVQIIDNHDYSLFLADEALEHIQQSRQEPDMKQNNKIVFLKKSL